MVSFSFDKKKIKGCPSYFSIGADYPRRTQLNMYLNSNQFLYGIDGKIKFKGCDGLDKKGIEKILKKLPIYFYEDNKFGGLSNNLVYNKKDINWTVERHTEICSSLRYSRFPYGRQLKIYPDKNIGYIIDPQENNKIKIVYIEIGNKTLRLHLDLFGMKQSELELILTAE